MFIFPLCIVISLTKTVSSVFPIVWMVVVSLFHFTEPPVISFTACVTVNVNVQLFVFGSVHKSLQSKISNGQVLPSTNPPLTRALRTGLNPSFGTHTGAITGRTRVLDPAAEQGFDL